MEAGTAGRKRGREADMGLSRKTGSAVPPDAMLAANAIAARSLGLAES